MCNCAGKTKDLGHSPSTGSNREHQWSRSSFGLGETVSRESYEIQNEGDGIIVLKPPHESRKILWQASESAPQH